MIVVGCDLATRSGICHGRPDRLPTAFTVRAPVTGEDYGAFGSFYFKIFRKLLTQLAADLAPGEQILVCYESPYLPVPKWNKKLGKMEGGTSIQVTRKLHSLGVLLETVASLFQEETCVRVEVTEANLGKLKHTLAGSITASKDDMVFVARRAGIVLPAGEEAKDAADAFSAWFQALQIRCPEHAEIWLRRIHGSREFMLA